MNKLVILTASIIRGDFHKKTIGKFYEIFYEYLKEYDIYHIINIDEPKNLKFFLINMRLCRFIMKSSQKK